MNFIPRRIHPVAIMVKDAIIEAEECFMDESNQLKCIHQNENCDCCGEFWSVCNCLCHHCQGEYKICKYECYSN